MRWSDLAATSLSSLQQRPFRTGMTMLGVVIGTMAVIVMISLGVGMTQSITGGLDNKETLTQISVIGKSNSSGPLGAPGRFGDGSGPVQPMNRAVIAQLEKYDGIEAIVPTYTANVTITSGSMTSYLNVTGIDPADYAALGLELVEGSMPQNSTKLALAIGYKVPEIFALQSGDDEAEPPALVGRAVQLQFEELSVPGGAAPTDPTSEQMTPPAQIVTPIVGRLDGDENSFSEQAFSIYAPLDALVLEMRKLTPAGQPLPRQNAANIDATSPVFNYSSFIIKADSVESAEALTKQLNDDGWQIESNIQMLQEMKKIALAVQGVFGGIGFISLLVAAIGIANTMMMSVYERTRQIGVMKVLGASLADIRASFLLESAGIGLIGGVIGLLVSLAISGLMNVILGSAAETKISIIPWWLMLGAVVFSTAIGAIAGFAPAQRAMRLSPLAAIRAE